MILDLEPSDFNLTLSNFDVFRSKVYEGAKLIQGSQGPKIIPQIGAVSGVGQEYPKIERSSSIMYAGSAVNSSSQSRGL